MSDESRSSDRHIPVLDGLRGLAIALVLLFHFTGTYNGVNCADRFVLTSLHAGWTGVELFFVLSGFLITGIIYDAKGSRHFLRNFYMRRILRIFPLYYGFLFTIFVVLPLFRPFHSPEMIHNAKDQLWFWTYTTNFGIALKGPGTFGVLGHFWTLAIEEQFYLLWPLTILLCRRSQAIRACLCFISLAFLLRIFLLAHGASYVVLYTLTPCRLDSLLMGALIALLARGPGGLHGLLVGARRTFAVASLIIVALFISCGSFLLELPLVQVFGYSAVSALFGTALIQVLCVPAAASFFGSRVLRLLGKYSYSLYVIHVPAQSTLYKLFAFPKAHLTERLHSQFLAILPMIILGTTTLLLASALLWELWEAPFLKMKRFFPGDAVVSSGASADAP